MQASSHVFFLNCVSLFVSQFNLFHGIKKSFFQTKKGQSVLAAALAVILFTLIALGLNYFNLINLSRLTFLPKKGPVVLTGTAVNISLLPQNYGFRVGDLTLNCPLQSTFCNSQKLTSINKADVLLYKANPGASVSASIKVPDLANIAVGEDKGKGKKYFYESVVSKDGASCYTISYTLPSDATFGDILSLPNMEKAQVFAILGKNTFTVGRNEANVLVQVRNTPIDHGIPCSLIKKSPDFFKAFN